MPDPIDARTKLAKELAANLGLVWGSMEPETDPIRWTHNDLKRLADHCLLREKRAALEVWKRQATCCCGRGHCIMCSEIAALSKQIEALKSKQEPTE